MGWWKRLPFFYGWIVVAVSFICFVVGYATWHSFSIFYVAILEDFGWSRAATAGAFSLFTVIYGVNSPVAGWLIDRFGPRVVFPGAAIIMAVGLLLTTRLSSIWEFYLLYGFVAAVGLSGMGIIPNFAVINNWFARKRGTAAGFATAGIGVGTFFLVPILQTIISSYGWRTAYLVLATAILLVIPTLAIVFQRHRPQDLGLLPDGDSPATRSSATVSGQAARRDLLVVDREWTSREWTVGSAMRTSRYWIAFAGRFLELGCQQLVMVHQAAFFVDMGYDKLLVASVVGLVGIVGSGAKIMWGFVSDRFGREITYVVAYAAGTSAVLLMLWVRPGSPIWMLYCYAVLYGFVYGVSAVVFPALTGDIFHGKRFGAILGSIAVSGGVGSAVGAFIGGYIFDLTDSYTLAFAMAIPGMWISCLCYWLAAPRKVRMVAGKARKLARLQPEG